MRYPTLWMAVACTAAAATLALVALTESAPAHAAKPTPPAVAPEQGLPMPWLRLTVGQGGAVISGTVPNAIERDAVLAWARKQYPQL